MSAKNGIHRTKPKQSRIAAHAGNADNSWKGGKHDGEQDEPNQRGWITQICNRPCIALLAVGVDVRSLPAATA